MKRSGCAAFGCAGGLVIALALVTGVATWLEFPHPAPDADPDAYRQVGALNQFRRDDEGERLRLTYGFIDYSGQARHVSCEIDRRDYDRDVTSFGDSEDELNGTVGEGLRELFEREAERREVRPYVHFETDVTGYRCVAGAAPGDGEEDRSSHGGGPRQILEEDLPRKKRVMHRSPRRGRRMEGETIELDYHLRSSATPARSLIFRTLRRAG